MKPVKQLCNMMRMDSASFQFFAEPENITSFYLK